MASPEFPLPLYHGTSTLFLPDRFDTLPTSNMARNCLPTPLSSCADSNLAFVRRVLSEMPGGDLGLLQQTNFRLRSAVPIERIRAWLIVVTKWHGLAPRYQLHELSLVPGQSAA
jgi:hypothetical protein